MCLPVNDSTAKVEVDIMIVGNFVVFGYVCNYGVRGEEHVVDVGGYNCLSLETSANVNAPVRFYTSKTNILQLRVEVQVPLATRLFKAIKPLS